MWNVLLILWLLKPVILKYFQELIIDFANLVWGTPLLILLLGGGVFFVFYSELRPLLHIKHAIHILLGRYDEHDKPGQIDHYQALSTAIAATVGMGNISGVAIAISMGGPGAIFWMWVSALIGTITKFFTCSLAVMYRGKDDSGEIQGGPMYVIREGLGKKWKPLAIFFALMGMIGVSPMFQTNQMVQAFRDIILVPAGVEAGDLTNLIAGLVIMLVVALVIFGGIKRIGTVTGRLVPFMVLIYIIAVLYILCSNTSEILPSLKLIVYDAFTGKAAAGGAVGAIIITGVCRAAFSNEAGIGTAPMAHGAAKTAEPIREGLVAMLGPIIDTIIVCTMTALAIIVTGVWENSDSNGISLTAQAFAQAMPGVGPYILSLCVTIFALTTLFAFPYYGTKCFAFIFGTKYQLSYNIIYVFAILLGALTSLGFVISIFDAAYALMAFPTMISALILSPKVKKEMRIYFSKLKS